MHVRGPIVEVQRPSNETRLTAFPGLPEALQSLRLRTDRGLVRTGKIDASEKDRPSSVIDELCVRGMDEVRWNGSAGRGRDGGYTRHVSEQP